MKTGQTQNFIFGGCCFHNTRFAAVEVTTHIIPFESGDSVRCATVFLFRPTPSIGRLCGAAGRLGIKRRI
jgi:hypothetical protein